MDNDAPLEYQIQQALAGSGKTLATAESCAGGLIAHRLTNVSGASEYFVGGIIAYSNSVKMSLLGVPPALLDQFGAVSEPVARAMAEGARDRLCADVAVSVTGVAGPGGGTPEKPVGLVYVAVSDGGETRVKRCQFTGSREEIKSKTADAALGLLMEYLR